MSHDTHTKSKLNQDASPRSLEWCLEQTQNWQDPYGPLVVHDYHTTGKKRVKVVRDDLLGVGSKARFGDLLVATAKSHTLVYVAPRVGYAGMSLAALCKKHGKKLILFAPASVEASEHQLMACEQGADLIFQRIAAMPNLNAMAQAYAKEKGFMFVPFGLNHPLVTACAVRVAHDYALAEGEPEEAWSVISTGVLTRALQIAWPTAKFRTVAVARNIKDGEKGRATIISHPLDFIQDTKKLPPFPSVASYDAKAWEYVKAKAKNGALFWNVAGPITKPRVMCPSSISSPGWKDKDLRAHTLSHKSAISKI